MVYERNNFRHTKSNYFIKIYNFEKHLKIKEINFTTVPFYEEFKMESMIEIFSLKEHEAFYHYVPEILSEKRIRDRNFISTLLTLFFHIK